jgi:hypothetical protein
LAVLKHLSKFLGQYHIMLLNSLPPPDIHKQHYQKDLSKNSETKR